MEALEDQPSVFERHMQTVVVLCIATLLVWITFTTNESSKEIVRLQEQVRALVERLDTQAGNTTRLTNLETRVSILEDRMRLTK
ncbi:MAG: hypothetical protein HUJ30_08415 [Gammaproteobacteria bacterium]|nr:hypothetical protein [Gammaproteobacteria bacterium]